MDPGPRRDSRFVPVAEFPDRHEAELVRGFLEGEGIDVALRTDDAGGVHPPVNIAVLATVLVPEGQVEEAREALAALVGGDAIEADLDDTDLAAATSELSASTSERGATDPVAGSHRRLGTWLVAAALLALIALYLLVGGPVPTLP